MVRLKFRLPNGSSSLAQFSDDALLSEVQKHIQENISLPFSRFNMTSTLHQRAFSSEDLTSTLRNLGLVPSAIIIISPVSRFQ